MQRRAVITGYGIISSIGNNCEEVLHSLQGNKSGLVFVPEWAELGFKSCVAGTIKGLDADDVRQKLGLKSRYMDMSALYSTLSSLEAVAGSGLAPEDLTSERVACIIGSGVSNTEPIYQAGAKLFSGNGRITPYGVTRSMTSSCSANLVNFYGIKGRSYSISSACATSLHNIGHACELIWSDRCDMALAGGADEVSAIMTANFDGMRSALSTAFNNTPQQASRPYDKKRDGFVISGGAGIVIVEELEHAQKRNALIYAEVTGYGASSDGHDIIQPQPQGDGAYRCLKEALGMVHSPVETIDYINTHGTGTPAGDLAECLAIRRAFGDYKVPISSTKALSGHGIGAAGAQELIYCLLMMKNGFITASANIEELDPEFAECNIVRENRDAKLNRVLTSSFGFGGTNACMIVDKM
jgi:3-oxoacyl-[acyl-carrier-protein] synthase I